MRKQIIPYILSAACLLSACSADYFSEPDPVTTPDDSEMLSLTVSASDGLSSRSTEEGGVTTFNTGDCVGLIVLDSEGNFFANNIPYIYDNGVWKFHADNTEGKQPVYYDAEMYTYIVYYPYTKDADNCKSLKSIVGLPIFEYQTNQSSEDTYRKADVLVWEHSGNLRSIDAKMWHAHDSFSLNTKLKWTLVPLGKKDEEGKKEDAVLEYQPLRETLKDFSIVYKIDGKEEIVILNDESDLTYHDKDGSYRYLLPTDKQEATIEWQYTYRNITFRGTQVIDAVPTGKRYLINESADMGELPGGNMQISDFYCSNEQNIGYVFPWDAWETEEAERDFPGRHCIGLVVGVGQNENDISVYKKSGIGETRCNGYVLSLTELTEPLAWATSGSSGAKQLVGTCSFTENSVAEKEWSGYYNHMEIEQFALNPTNETDLTKFPAANACRSYGSKCGLSAPTNSSGWFLPSYGMLTEVRSMTNIATAASTYDTMENLLTARFDVIKQYIEDKKDLIYNEIDEDYKYKDNIIGFIGADNKANEYWSSTENRLNASTLYAINSPSTQKTGQKKTDTYKQRAFLAF